MKADEDKSELSRVWEIAEKNRKDAELWEMQYNAVVNSLSWKVTSPLRVPGLLKRALLFCYFKLADNLRSWIKNAFLKHNFVETHNRFISNRQNANYLGEAGLPPQSNKYSSEITVSVVTFNNFSYFESFINSLLGSYCPSNVNLMIRDNGSDDEQKEICEKLVNRYKPKFKSVSVHYGDNVGFGMGHDFNVRRSSNDLVLVTNVDLEFNESSIVNLLISANTSDGSVACWEARQTPFEHPKFYDPFTHYTYWCSHACILIDRKKYKKIGGYDSNIFMYGEDVELSFRFRKKGYNLQYVPKATVVHHTYEDADTFKPLMFSGSLFANVYLRLKYGSLFEALAGIAQLKILEYRETGERKQLVEDAKSKLPLSLLSKSALRKNNLFIFNAFDYDLRRVGDFYTVKETGDDPLCTVIVRTYKGRELLLKEALQSILNQTYVNFEILVCVDGGETFQSEFLESLEANEKIKVYLLPKKGRSFAGNFGLQNASGKYVCFLDDDDGFFADHLEQLLANLNTYDDCRAAYSLAFEVLSDLQRGADGSISGYTEYDVKTNPYFLQDFDRSRLAKENYFPIQSVLFEKDLFKEAGGFDESFEHLEDWNLWFKYATIAKFKYVEKTTSFFRVPYNVEQRVGRQKQLDEAYESVKASNFEFYSKFAP